MSDLSYWSKAGSMVTSRRRLLRGAIGGSAGVAGLWLLACSSSNNNNGGAKATGTTAGTIAASATRAGSPAPGAPAVGTARPGGSPAAQAGPQPKRGGSVNYPGQTEPPNQDVNMSSSSGANQVAYGCCYSTVVKPQSYGHGGKLIPQGDLAENWEQPDKTTYVFHLRKNAKWQNIAPVNGRAVTADDIVYSMNRQTTLKVNASTLGGAQNFSAVDPNTLKLTVPAPNVDFLASFTDPNNKVLTHEAVELKGDLVNGPTIGSGPWIFKDGQKGVGYSDVRNPDYYIPGLPYADNLTWPIILDTTQLEAQFQAGKLTFLTVGNPGMSEGTLKSLDKNKYKIYSVPPLQGSQWIMYNLAKPDFQDLRIRKALDIAIDRDLIVQNVYAGSAVIPGQAMVLPGPDWRLGADEIKKLQPYDPKTAKQMLDAAGGLKPHTLYFYRASDSPATTQLVQAAFKAIGFETTLSELDNVGLTGNIFNPAVANFEIACSPISHSTTLSADFGRWYKTGGSTNSMHLSDPKLDQLLDQQQQEFDERKRRDLVNQLQRYIIDQCYNPALVASQGRTVYAATTHNVEPPPGGTSPSHYLAEIWFDNPS